MPTFSHLSASLSLKPPPPAELAAKHGVRGLSEGPNGVGEPAEGKSSGSAR